MNLTKLNSKGDTMFARQSALGLRLESPGKCSPSKDARFMLSSPRTPEAICRATYNGQLGVSATVDTVSEGGAVSNLHGEEM